MTTLTQEQINWLDKCAKGTWTLNHNTGLVDVDGNFDCRNQGLKGFKGVKFGRVGGHFWCNYNLLTSLEGGPQEVGSDFNCAGNLLTSLEEAPQSVGGSFYCHNNQLTSLVGAPQEVDENFECDENRLISLVGAPQKIGGYFSCNDNLLTSLVGATLNVRLGWFSSCGNPVSAKTLDAIFRKMQEGHSFAIAAASLRNEMSKTSWKFIAPHIPDAIRPGVSMLGRFGLFN